MDNVLIDPNAFYPVGTVILIVISAIVGLKIFVLNNDHTKDISRLEGRIEEIHTQMASKETEFVKMFVSKEDVEKKLDEINSKVEKGFLEMKLDIAKSFDLFNKLLFELNKK